MAASGLRAIVYVLVLAMGISATAETKGEGHEGKTKGKTHHGGTKSHKGKGKGHHGGSKGGGTKGGGTTGGTTGGGGTGGVTGPETNYGDIQVDKLIVMPDAAGHTDWVNAINGAKKSLHMTMYHITDSAIVTALSNLAKDKSVDLKVIVDGGSLTGGYLTVFNQMKSAGVDIVASSPSFTLTHSKSMIIDGDEAFVTAINLTNTYNNSRDFGIITPDASVISELETVFQADWANAQSKSGNTPSVSNGNLVWAPVSADAKLVKLIESATSTIDAETETFSDPDVISALNKAAAGGVNVRLIVPQCVLGNGAYNYTYLSQLSGVQVHVEVDGDSVAQPYMHSKMMVVDGQSVYIGSINYTASSMTKDREVGLIFTDAGTGSTLSSEFQTDWNRSQTAPSTAPSCSSSSDPISVMMHDFGY